MMIDNTIEKLFQGKFSGTSSLIISSGPSTRKLLQYKKILKNFFDVVIVVNSAIIDFEKQADFHIVMEVNMDIYKDLGLSNNNYRRDLPRIINYTSVARFPQDLNIFPSYRTIFGGKAHIRKFKYNNACGLLNGPAQMQSNGKQLRVGTVTLQAIHFAGIIGSSNIYLIGADFIFGKKYDHYYKDRVYRDGVISGHEWYRNHKIISVEHNNEKYETTEAFYNSAKYIDEIIEIQCKPNGINVYDFSNGLLTKPEKLDIDEFFKEK